MTPLDDVTQRLFPTLAAYARKVRRREILALIGTTLSAYIIGRDLLSAYQGRVATQSMQAMVGRVNSLEATCQKAYPGRLKVTKVQAWNAARQKERTIKIVPSVPSMTIDPGQSKIGPMRDE